jgi:hypothetical protein
VDFDQDGKLFRKCGKAIEGSYEDAEPILNIELIHNIAVMNFGLN